jgi:hypothetical protein
VDDGVLAIEGQIQRLKDGRFAIAIHTTDEDDVLPVSGLGKVQFSVRVAFEVSQFNLGNPQDPSPSIHSSEDFFEPHEDAMGSFLVLALSLKRDELGKNVDRNLVLVANHR